MAEIKTDKTPITRTGIIFSGSTELQDFVAQKDAGITLKLVDQWLGNGYQHIYVVMDIKNPWANRPEITVLPPTRANLITVAGAVAATAQSTSHYVDFIGLGHGAESGLPLGSSFISAAEFAQIFHKIPAAAQRSFWLVECHAAQFAAIPEMRDDNDLLVAFSGIETAKKKSEEPKTQLNITDGAELSILYATDVDGDRTLSAWERFWLGQKYVYSKQLAWSRGFVFDPGSAFIDRGFGMVAAKMPFPDTLVEFNKIAPLVDHLSKSYPRGITVIGYDLDSIKSAKTKQQLQQLAKTYRG